MSKRISRVLAIGLFILAVCVPSFAQDGAHTAYSPYSIFGIGDLNASGNARDKSMGGVGIAGRDRRYVNITNPAAISARDTLSAMFDFALASDNKIFRQGDIKSANNNFNISSFAMSFSVWKKTAIMMGISPYSNVGYDYSYNISDPSLLATTGFINYTSSGNGGMYQLFGGVGTTLWKRLSVGAEVVYYFGNIEKETTMTFSGTNFREISSGYNISANSVAGKFGIQYEQPIGDAYLTLGATYKNGSKLRGYVTDYKYATLSSIVDTVSYRVDTLAKSGNLRLASEVGVGISIRKPEKWSVEVNYTMSDWTSSGMDNVTGFSNRGSSEFSTALNQSVRAGFEFIPNRNDARYYFRQCAYRGGLYYQQAYYKLDGNTVNSYGLTLGVTLPVFRWYNGVSLGVDIGQRGSVSGNMVKENYFNFVIGFNIHDIWFRKIRYN